MVSEGGCQPRDESSFRADFGPRTFCASAVALGSISQVMISPSAGSANGHGERAVSGEGADLEYAARARHEHEQAAATILRCGRPSSADLSAWRVSPARARRTSRARVTKMPRRNSGSLPKRRESFHSAATVARCCAEENTGFPVTCNHCAAALARPPAVLPPRLRRSGGASMIVRPMPTALHVLYLIRHAETGYNRDGRVQGHTESNLSRLGIEQARRIGSVSTTCTSWRRTPAPRNARCTPRVSRSQT